LALALFFSWLLAAVMSSVRAFLCVHPSHSGNEYPILDRGSHFHPAAIAKRYQTKDVDKFCREFEEIGAEGFRREVLSCLLMDAHVSKRKYANVIASIRWMGIMALLGFAYLVLIQF
jgi:hypothetical protein